jgi:hypothetical protein
MRLFIEADACRLLLTGARNKNPATRAGSVRILVSSLCSFCRLLSVQLAPSRQVYSTNGNSQRSKRGGFRDSRYLVEGVGRRKKGLLCLWCR